MIGHGGRFNADQLEAFARPTAETLEALGRDFAAKLAPVDALRVTYSRAEALVRNLRSSAKPVPAQTMKRAEQALARARTAFETSAKALQAEIDGRLRSAAPGAERLVRDVHTEAETDRLELTEGPQRDTNAWKKRQTLQPDWLIEGFRYECVNTNYDAALAARMSESRASTTMYQRLRSAYERLRPAVSDAERLPATPFVPDSDE